MNSARKLAAVVLAAVLLTGCTPKAKTVPPTQAQAPTAAPSTQGALYPPPLTTPPPETQTPAPPTPAPVAQEQPPPTTPAPAPAKPKKTASHKKTSKPAPDKTGDESQPAPAAATAGAPASDQPTQQAATGAPSPATSPIGQLTTDDPSTSGQTRHEADELINNTENGLNAVLKKSLSQDQQNTAAQIRVFLDKAKQAVSSDDLEGAKTLATKAKVLLEELLKQ